METSVKGRHVQITPDLQALVDRKLEKLVRLLNDSAVSAQVVLGQERQECTVEIVLHARGDHMLHGHGQATTWAQAIGTAVDKIDQQAHTLKGKWEGRHRPSTSQPAR